MFLEQISGVHPSDIILMSLVLALLVLVPGYVISQKKKIPYYKVVHLYLTLVYAGIILFITIIRRRNGMRHGEISTVLNLGKINGNYWERRASIYAFLNVLLFVPYGILLYSFREDDAIIKGFVMTVLMGFISSASIEIAQLITGRGLFEVTDLFTNVLGTLVGALIGGIIILVFKRICKLHEERQKAK